MLATIDDVQKPTVRICEADYERLANLAAVHTEGGALLAREIDRARILSEAQVAAEPAFVRLGSTVEYRDLLSGRARRVELTSPEDADIDLGRLSVLSPVGAALIGLAAGDTFSWTGDNGRPHVVLVEQVAAPPPAPLDDGPEAA